MAFYLPAEPYKRDALAILEAYARGELQLAIPALCWYEFLNALSKAVRGLRGGQRIREDDAARILRSFLDVGLQTVHWEGDEREILETSVRYGCSAYDAAYLVLASRRGWPAVTADDRLYPPPRGSVPGDAAARPRGRGRPQRRWLSVPRFLNRSRIHPGPAGSPAAPPVHSTCVLPSVRGSPAEGIVECPVRSQGSTPCWSLRS